MSRSAPVKNEIPSVETEAVLEPETTNLAVTFRALSHHNYRLFWFGSFLSNIGTWMQVVAQGYLVRDLTPSPLLIGLVAFSSAVPQLAFGLFSGVYADLFNRRKLLLMTQCAQLICAAALGALVLLRDWRVWLGLSIWHVMAISFASGFASTLATPAYQTLTLDIVGKEDLPSAVALNSAQFNLSRVIGPSMSGLMLGAVGIAGCYFYNSVSFLAVIFALSAMKFPEWRAPEQRNTREFVRQMAAGLRYAGKRPRVTALLGIGAIASIFGLPYLTFMPVFARDVLGRQTAGGLAYLWIATGCGAVVSALLMAFILTNSNRRGRLLLIGSALFGCAVIAFSLSRNFALSFVCLMFVGGGMVSITTTVNTLLQTLVRDEMRGRVMSMYGLTFLGFPPVGSFLIGALADLIGNRWGLNGVQLALALGGVVIVFCAVFVSVKVPRVRALA